jgi:hypothetical protein
MRGVDSEHSARAIALCGVKYALSASEMRRWTPEIARLAVQRKGSAVHVVRAIGKERNAAQRLAMHAMQIGRWTAQWWLSLALYPPYSMNIGER